MSRALAEEIAVAALGYIASDPRLLERFLSLSGIDPAEIRSAASDEGFLGGVLAFVMEHEAVLVALASGTGSDPAEIAAAAALLAPPEPRG
ncbi:DUF3572 family protein [Rhizobiales bacterium L72]|uniref:DUF3572 family protein n=2 Tax=Propylenella binzhouense TaxID=2555902 RepID=A0A964WSB2_9HYPH|nr:DUF3572 family protein [Propylenella binzhouense]